MSLVAHLVNKLLTRGWPGQFFQRGNDALAAPLLDSASILDISQRAQKYFGKGVPPRVVAQRLSGEATSIFRGRGLDYEESRIYQPGDDLRLMDWRLMARSSLPHIKVFHEEHRPAVFLLVDRRAAMRFGTQVRLKTAQAARVAALLAFAYRWLNTPVAGLCLQADPQWLSQSNDVEGIFYFINAIAKPCPPVTPDITEPYLSTTLKSLQTQLNRGSIIYLLSDFIDLEEQHRPLLMHLAAEFDVKAIHIVDPGEERLPNAGRLKLFGFGNATAFAIDTSNPFIRAEYQEAAKRHLDSREKLFKALNIPYMRMATNSDDIEKSLRLMGGAVTE